LRHLTTTLEFSYANQQKLAKLPREEEKSKVTWEKLENLSYHDLKGMDHDFHPSDLIEENDEEDQLYLAEYDLTDQKSPRKKEEASPPPQPVAPKKEEQLPQRGLKGNLSAKPPVGGSKSPPPALNAKKAAAAGLAKHDIFRDIEEDFEMNGGDTPPYAAGKGKVPFRPGGQQAPANLMKQQLRGNKSVDRTHDEGYEDQRYLPADPKLYGGQQKGQKMVNDMLVRASEIDIERKKKEQQVTRVCRVELMPCCRS
jgi:hypothetical protein